MNLERFLREREPDWQRLSTLADGAKGAPEKLGPDAILELASLYRHSTADLALARRRWPGDPVIGRLEQLVGRARHLVYDAPPRERSFVSFVTSDYWRLIRQRPALLLVAAALLLGPGLLAGIWGSRDPVAAAAFLPSEYSAITETPRTSADLEMSGAEQTAFSAFIFTNNIRVTFLAFAGGILAGIGTAAVLVFNGTLLGAVTGLSVTAGSGRIFFELVTAHGVLELSCIVVTAAAGLRVGWAMVDPGRGRRGEAVIKAATDAVLIVVGTMPWLVLAGLIEGYITPRGLGLPAVIAIGFGIASIYWFFVVRLGRQEELRGAPTS